MSFLSEKALFFWDWRWLTTALSFPALLSRGAILSQGGQVPERPIPAARCRKSSGTQEYQRALQGCQQLVSEMRRPNHTVDGREANGCAQHTQTREGSVTLKRRHEFSWTFLPPKWRNSRDKETTTLCLRTIIQPGKPCGSWH
uniref:Putative cytochrome n=1 Tax=Ixodes ricinus TaxID=34613 RepID=A0A090XB16_IXORI